MSSEDQELMARISQLAGQINRHKNQQAGLASSYPYPTSSQSRNFIKGRIPHIDHAHEVADTRGNRRGRPYPARGQRGGAPARHRQLIVNHGTNTNSASDGDSDVPATASWVTRNDRHRQLINATVYEKETQARTEAIEHTRQQKRLARDARERSRLVRHLKQVTQPPAGAGAGHEIVIEGVRFYVTKSGSRLARVPGPFTGPVRSEHSVDGGTGQNGSATPKMATIGGVKFYRSKNGNMYRHGVVKAQRQSGAIKKIEAPCRVFASTGSCTKGPRCRYVHDPSKVAACKDLLLKGSCPLGVDCDLSHDLTPQRVPHCVHFAKGSCSNAACRYTHTLLTPGAPVCRSFGIYGYCEKGAACQERHAFECPDFSNTGVCKTKGCKLLHRERASKLRRADAKEKERESGELDDLSSEEETDDDDSNDVDSDEVEEFLGPDDATDVDFAEQREFIAF